MLSALLLGGFALLAVLAVLDTYALDTRGVRATGVVTATQYGGRTTWVEVSVPEYPDAPSTTFDPPYPLLAVGDFVPVIVDPEDPSVFRLASSRFDSYFIFVGAGFLVSAAWFARSLLRARPVVLQQ